MKAERRVTLVTGASGGIGADLARVFACHGHDLALIARSAEKLEALADEIAASGQPKPLVIAADLTEREAIETIAARLEAEACAVEILINNAGYGLVGEIAELDAADQLGIIDLNIRALTGLTIAFAPQIRRLRGGILNVASIVAFMPGPGMAVYYASKAFVRSFSRALWQEMRASGVSVTLLCPGLTRTGFQTRAAMDASKLPSFASMGSREVAEAGYRGLAAKRRIVVPGILNKFSVIIIPLLPDALILPLLSRIQGMKLKASRDER